jgi:hypothetical protein
MPLIVGYFFVFHIIDTVNIFKYASMTIMVPKIIKFPFKELYFPSK